MSSDTLQCMHQDLELIKKDVSLIKHILLEEAELSETTKSRLQKARTTPFSEYKKL